MVLVCPCRRKGVRPDANSSSTTTADCVPLVCTSNADCAGESTAACVDGQCRAAR